MSLQSMTGFARSEGEYEGHRFAWELRSVNGKGLDLRLRLPTGLEHLEADIRKVAGELLTRGNVQAGLSISSAESRLVAVVNRDALAAVLALRTELGELVDPAPLRLDTLLSIRGLVDFRDADESAEVLAGRDKAVLAAFSAALTSLAAMRRTEGAALRDILSGHIDRIAVLVEQIAADPSRSPAEISARIAAQLASIGNISGIDRDRLHLEVALIATKADIREELDRLGAHVAAARDLLEKGGPVGRKLDFLAQEFNREANTICSKSNAAAVTAAGLELKVSIDQFREQVQNLE